MRLLFSRVARFLRPLSYEPGALVLAVAVCGAAAVLETSRVTHKHAQKTGRSRAARTRRTANFASAQASKDVVPARERPRVPGQYPEPKRAEGAYQIQNGKWRSTMFPGRDFDDLDAYRAAKKQRMERRAAYSAQLNAYPGHN